MRAIGWSLALALLPGLSGNASAAADADLVALINAGRAEPRDCAGQRAAPVIVDRHIPCRGSSNGDTAAGPGAAGRA